MSDAPQYKLGNEKLIKVLPNASNRLLGLLLAAHHEDRRGSQRERGRNRDAELPTRALRRTDDLRAFGPSLREIDDDALLRGRLALFALDARHHGVGDALEGDHRLAIGRLAHVGAEDGERIEEALRFGVLAEELLDADALGVVELAVGVCHQVDERVFGERGAVHCSASLDPELGGSPPDSGTAPTCSV